MGERAEDEKGQARMLPGGAGGYTGSDPAHFPKLCSHRAGRKVRKKAGTGKPGRSPRLAKEMLGTDGTWRALPRLQSLSEETPCVWNRLLSVGMKTGTVAQREAGNTNA